MTLESKATVVLFTVALALNLTFDLPLLVMAALMLLTAECLISAMRSETEAYRNRLAAGGEVSRI